MPVDYAKHGAWLTKETFAGAGNRPAAVPQVGPTHAAAALSWGDSYTGKQLAAAPPLSFAVGDSATSFACMRSVAPAAASAGHTEPAEEASALAIPRAHLRGAGTASCSTIGERAAPAAAIAARTERVGEVPLRATGSALSTEAGEQGAWAERECSHGHWVPAQLPLNTGPPPPNVSEQAVPANGLLPVLESSRGVAPQAKMSQEAAPGPRQPLQAERCDITAGVPGTPHFVTGSALQRPTAVHVPVDAPPACSRQAGKGAGAPECSPQRALTKTLFASGGEGCVLAGCKSSVTLVGAAHPHWTALLRRPGRMPFMQLRGASEQQAPGQPTGRPSAPPGGAGMEVTPDARGVLEPEWHGAELRTVPSAALWEHCEACERGRPPGAGLGGSSGAGSMLAPKHPSAMQPAPAVPLTCLPGSSLTRAGARAPAPPLPGAGLLSGVRLPYAAAQGPTPPPAKLPLPPPQLLMPGAPCVGLARAAALSRSGDAGLLDACALPEGADAQWFLPSAPSAQATPSVKGSCAAAVAPPEPPEPLSPEPPSTHAAPSSESSWVVATVAPLSKQQPSAAEATLVCTGSYVAAAAASRRRAAQDASARLRAAAALAVARRAAAETLAAEASVAAPPRQVKVQAPRVGACSVLHKGTFYAAALTDVSAAGSVAIEPSGTGATLVPVVSKCSSAAAPDAQPAPPSAGSQAPPVPGVASPTSAPEAASELDSMKPSAPSVADCPTGRNNPRAVSSLQQRPARKRSARKACPGEHNGRRLRTVAVGGPAAPLSSGWSSPHTTVHTPRQHAAAGESFVAPAPRASAAAERAVPLARKPRMAASAQSSAAPASQQACASAGGQNALPVAAASPAALSGPADARTRSACQAMSPLQLHCADREMRSLAMPQRRPHGAAREAGLAASIARLGALLQLRRRTARPLSPYQYPVKTLPTLRYPAGLQEATALPEQMPARPFGVGVVPLWAWPGEPRGCRGETGRGACVSNSVEQAAMVSSLARLDGLLAAKAERCCSGAASLEPAAACPAAALREAGRAAPRAALLRPRRARAAQAPRDPSPAHALLPTRSWWLSRREEARQPRRTSAGLPSYPNPCCTRGGREAPSRTPAEELDLSIHDAASCCLPGCAPRAPVEPHSRSERGAERAGLVVGGQGAHGRQVPPASARLGHLELSGVCSPRCSKAGQQAACAGGAQNRSAAQRFCSTHLLALSAAVRYARIADRRYSQRAGSARAASPQQCLTRNTGGSEAGGEAVSKAACSKGVVHAYNLAALL